MRRAATGALLATFLKWVLLDRRPGGFAGWRRTNYRGAAVSLLSGPVLMVAAGATARLPTRSILASAVGAGLVGRYDDVAGAEGTRGLRGHLGALRDGSVTTGSLKVVGMAAAGVASVRSLDSGRRTERLVAALLVAGSANLLNLLDLRPGRALKVGAALAACMRQPGVCAVCLALMPADLGERTMLGDAGANSLGALLGASAVQRWGPGRQRVALLVVVALTAASEVVSYSAVIDRVGPLRWLDRLGRRR